MSLVAGLFPSQWLHPGGSGYWFYSGVFDVGLLLGILSSVGVYWRAHNCHVNGCWRLDWHPHPTHDHPVCRLHHPEGGADFLHRRHHLVKVSTAASRPDRASRNGSDAAMQGDPWVEASEVGDSQPTKERR
jgi:hypothetical protein